MMEEGEVAERRRRDEEPDNEHLDEALFDDSADDDALDDEEPVGRSSRSGGGTATKARPRAEERPRRDSDRVGFFGGILRFIREVVAELRKVIWPTRKELLTYTAVVLVFVAVLMTVVASLDYGFAKAVLWVFGSPNKE